MTHSAPKPGGEPTGPQAQLARLGPQWAAAAESAFAGVASSPPRYVAASRWVAAWLEQLRGLTPGPGQRSPGDSAASDSAPGDGKAAVDSEAAGDAAAAALLAAWDAREAAPASAAGLPLAAAERAALTAAAFAIRYAEVAAWLACRRRRAALAAARIAPGQAADGDGWVVLEEAGDPAGDLFITYRRLEADPQTGAGVLTATRPDDGFTTVIHEVHAVRIDLSTGELTTGNTDEHWEFASPAEREELIGSLRAGGARTQPAQSG